MSNLSDERKDYLLKQLVEYRFDKETNLKALKELKSKLNVLTTQFNNEGNVVAYQSSRIKTENSFLNKINTRLDNNKNLEYKEMHDIVGARLICLSLSDVKKMVDLIKKSNIKIINEKDYISKPKKSGYMSYHMIVEIPVTTDDGEKLVKCEIQLRTILMDIFAREEHKLSYKGNASEEDKKTLKILSDKLFFYDSAIDNLFKIDNPKLKEESDSDLTKYKDEYNKISYMFDDIHEEYNSKINELVSEYCNSDDILHLTSRIKPIQSLKRKLERKKLSASTDDILYNIRDIVGFKIVTVDDVTAKDFIKYFVEKMGKIENLTVVNESDRLDEPKESGYRGYKINFSCNKQTINGEKTVTFEVLIRTMIMDAWALHDDKVFNNEDNYDSDYYVNATRQLKGLSPALHDVEVELSKLKTKVGDEPEMAQADLVSEVIEYKTKKLTL